MKTWHFASWQCAWVMYEDTHPTAIMVRPSPEDQRFWKWYVNDIDMEPKSSCCGRMLAQVTAAAYYDKTKEGWSPRD